MKYKHLQNANVDISSVGIGTWAIGGQRFGEVQREESIRSIHEMIAHGVNIIDTAPVYGNGYAEQVVGEALQNGLRDKVMIATKFGLAATYLDPFKHDASFHNIMREVMSSLRNLQTDYIDFYFIHWPDPATPIRETMLALQLLKQMGAIRFIGASNFSRCQLEEAMQYGHIDVIQNQYCMVDSANTAMMKWAKQQHIDAFTYGSMGAGMLTGVYRTLPDFPDDDIRLCFYDYFKEPKFSKIQELLLTLDQIADKRKVSVSQIALNYTAAQDFVGTCLVGTSKVRHALDNAAAFDFTLSQKETHSISEKIKVLDF
ncbi:MAG: aldo/keto reductase [[Clostridium] innocuum]